MQLEATTSKFISILENDTPLKASPFLPYGLLVCVKATNKLTISYFWIIKYILKMSFLGDWR